MADQVHGYMDKSDFPLKRKVYLYNETGSGTAITLAKGALVCFDPDVGTAASVDFARAWEVEKPATANLAFFAGVVAEGLVIPDGERRFFDIITPFGNPLVQVLVKLSCTINSTKIGVGNGQYYAQAPSASIHPIGQAEQTLNTSAAEALVLCRIHPVGALTPAATQTTAIKSAAMTAVIATYTLTGPTDGGTAPAATAQATANKAAHLKNYSVMVQQLNKAKDDILAIKTALTTVGLM